jgi:hypothetical protein
MGSPTVIADISAPGGQSELAARLVDVAPGGTESLVARGLLRPGEGGTKMVFQLHPQAFHFAEGEVAKLELLPSDAPYARPSNSQQTIEVSNLELRLPVLEAPGSLGGLVQAPAPKVLPPGYQLAAGYTESEPGGEEKSGGGEEHGGGGNGGSQNGNGGKGGAPVTAGSVGLSRGKITAKGKALRLRLNCVGPSQCTGSLTVSGGGKNLAGGSYSIPTGTTARLNLPLTGAGRKFLASHRKRRKGIPVKLSFTDAGRGPTPFELTRPVHLH